MPAATHDHVKDHLTALAKAEGFSIVGFAPVEPQLRTDYYKQWIAEGQHGEMSWMERNNERRLAPTNILPEARSIIMLGLNYYQDYPERRGRLSRYALGGDYHKFIYKRLKKICTLLQTHGGAQKPYVDTGPVLEKPIAAQTSIGWQGKHTVVINTKQGPWLFLGTIITTLEFTPDEPIYDHCGNCTKCITACPTEAITAPYQLDARKCIAYLTIENPGSIPLEYREAIGDRVFGCDECLDVCPWNRKAQQTREIKLQARPLPDLRETLSWTDDDFAAHFNGTPLSRLKLNRWLRNVCVVLGNIGTPEDLPELKRLTQHENPMVAEHATWAVGKIEPSNERNP